MNMHRKINKLLVDFALGELSSEAQAEIEEHLSACTQCSVELKRLRMLLESTEHIRELSAGDQTCESAERAILQAVRSQIMKQTSRPAISLNSIRKTITRSLIAKIAATVVITTAIALLLHNGSMNITTPAFGLDDVIATLNNVQWMHSQYEYLDSTGKAHRTYNDNKLAGSWFAANPHRRINIRAGEIIYDEYALGKQIVYHSKSNTITISYKGLNSEAEYPSIAEMVMRDISNEEKWGAKVTYKNGRLDGRSVMIINVDTSNAKGMIDSACTLYVDPKTRLPIKLKYNRINGRKVKSDVFLVYDFPEKGPNDIYEAGAPRDAKVMIPHSKDNPYIVQTPDVPELVQALRRYNAARDNLLTDYILIATCEDDSTMRMLDVIYHQGKNQYENQRSICYSARSLVESQGDNKPIEYNFESLLEWTKTKDNDYQSTAIIHNGGRFFSAEIELTDPWITEGKRHWPLGMNSLLNWGWPEILPKANVHQIQNDYSRENGLLAFERTIEPEISNGKLMNAVQKYIYYLDPNRDYMCVRKEEYQRFVMGGTPIKNIKFDVNEIPRDISCIQYVSQFAQTEKGQWYPRRIETHSKSWDANGNPKPLSLSFITTLYLKTNPEFPERFFNPERPPVPKNLSYQYSSKKPIEGD